MLWDTVGKCVYVATVVIGSKDDVFIGLSKVCVRMKRGCIPLGEVDSIRLGIVFGAPVVVGSRNVFFFFFSAGDVFSLWLSFFI
jgi:hypothetical protein